MSECTFATAVGGCRGEAVVAVRRLVLSDGSTPWRGYCERHAVETFTYRMDCLLGRVSGGMGDVGVEFGPLSRMEGNSND